MWKKRNECDTECSQETLPYIQKYLRDHTRINAAPPRSCTQLIQPTVAHSDLLALLRRGDGTKGKSCVQSWGAEAKTLRHCFHPGQPLCIWHLHSTAPLYRSRSQHQSTSRLSANPFLAGDRDIPLAEGGSVSLASRPVRTGVIRSQLLRCTFVTEGRKSTEVCKAISK